MTPLTFFFLCCEKKIDEQLDEEREKKNKKNHLHMNRNRAYMHGYCSFTKQFCVYNFTNTDMGGFLNKNVQY